MEGWKEWKKKGIKIKKDRWVGGGSVAPFCSLPSVEFSKNSSQLNVTSTFLTPLLLWFIFTAIISAEAALNTVLITYLCFFFMHAFHLIQMSRLPHLWLNPGRQTGTSYEAQHLAAKESHIPCRLVLETTKGTEGLNSSGGQTNET